jgi:threonine/homoserine/homoserine lactone efflux protein
MKPVKNITVGFIVSFLGSLPLGYLNIIGVEVFSKFGMNSLVSFLIGVIIAQTVVVYLTVIFANKLVSNKKLMKGIDFFAVLFLLLLAYLFYAHSNQTAEEHNHLEDYVQYSPFLIGMVLCTLNFLQIPFWMAWNLYLMNASHISLARKLKFHYIFGTLMGTFWGMFVAILALDSLSHSTFSFSKYIMPLCIPLFFVVLALYQTFKVYKKYFKKYLQS